MATRIYTSEGQAALVSRHDVYGSSAIPEIIRFVDPSAGATSAPQCYFHMTNFQLKHGANSQIAKTLEGALYYNSFGSTPLRLTMGGLVIVPTASNIDGYPTGDAATDQYLDFIEDHIATDTHIDASDTVTVSLQNRRDYRCLLINSVLNWKYTGGMHPLFHFSMTLLVIDRE